MSPRWYGSRKRDDTRANLLAEYGRTKEYGWYGHIWYYRDVKCDDGRFRSAYTNDGDMFRVKIGGVWHYGLVTSHEPELLADVPYLVFEGVPAIVRLMSYSGNVLDRLRSYNEYKYVGRVGSVLCNPAAFVLSDLYHQEVQCDLRFNTVTTYIVTNSSNGGKAQEYEMPEWIVRWLTELYNNVPDGYAVTARQALESLERSIPYRGVYNAV